MTNSLCRSVVWALKATFDKFHQASVLVILLELRAPLGKFKLCQNNFEIIWLWLYLNFLSSSSSKFFWWSGCRKLVLMSHDFSHSWRDVCFLCEESIDNLKFLVLLFQGRKLLLKIVNRCQEWGFYFIDIFLGKPFCLLLTCHIKYNKWWGASALSWAFVFQILYFLLQNHYLFYKRLLLFYLYINVLSLLFLPFATLL